MGSNEPIGVFISSTMGELQEERRAVKDALTVFDSRLRAWLWEDDAPAQDRSIRRVYLEEIERCSVYLGLFWLKYGEYTIEEFRRATACRKPRLIFVKDVDAERRDPRLVELLEEISAVDSGLTPEWFTDRRSLTPRLLRAVREQSDRMFPDWRPPPLPAHDPLFAGRDREIAELQERMEGEAPVALMALEGMGGLGKTALARELCHRVRDGFPGGVFWL
ncbi:MAG: DUF4062 domain-containing protein, partial [Planctomycetes bacterium]|nr:DUF4062 domain-containing protein [Planctomycetota bacterium]